MLTRYFAAAHTRLRAAVRHALRYALLLDYATPYVLMLMFACRAADYFFDVCRCHDTTPLDFLMLIATPLHSMHTPYAMLVAIYAIDFVISPLRFSFAMPFADADCRRRLFVSIDTPL